MKLPRSVRESGTRRPKSVFATRVETWKYCNRSVLCPACNEEVVPILLTKQHKYTNSRLAAFCLLGCWPLCFVPLMTCRDKSARTVCPLCGHNFCSQFENRCERRSSSNCHGKQLPASLHAGRKCARSECEPCCRRSEHEAGTAPCGDQQELCHTLCEGLLGGEQQRQQILRRRIVSPELPPAERIHRQSQLSLPRENVLCSNQVTAVDHCYHSHAADRLTNCSQVKFDERYQRPARHEHLPHHYVEDGGSRRHGSSCDRDETRSRYGRNRDDGRARDRYGSACRHGEVEAEDDACAYHSASCCCQDCQ